jgi:hypothetical protein
MVVDLLADLKGMCGFGIPLFRSAVSWPQTKARRDAFALHLPQHSNDGSEVC